MVRVLLAHDDENVMVAEQIARSRRVAQIPVPRKEFEKTAV